MDTDYRLRKLEMEVGEIAERLTNVEELVRTHIYYPSLGPRNYCNNDAQSKSNSTNQFSFEEFSMISKRLANVEKELQSKRENVPVMSNHTSPTNKVETNNGHFSPHTKNSTIRGAQGNEPEPVMTALATPTNSPGHKEATALLELHSAIVPSNASIYNGVFFKKFREILNKLNTGNFEKLAEEFLDSVESENNFSEVATFVFAKAINEVDNPTSPIYYAQLMAKVISMQDSNLNSLSTELRKTSMVHFSELFDVKDVSSSSSSVSLTDGQLSEIATAKRRTKGILRFISELFKVDIIHFEDMRNFVDCLLMHPQESNLNHLCLLLKLTGNLLELKSNALENVTTGAASGNSTHTNWFTGVCVELERNKEFCSNRTKFAIMDVMELRDKHWAMDKPPTLSSIETEKFVKPIKGSTLWRDRQQESIESEFDDFRATTTTCSTTAQQYTLFPMPSGSGENCSASTMLNTSSQPLAYNQVVRKSIVNVNSLELSASLPSINACISQAQVRDTLKMQVLSQSQLSLVRSGNSRSPSVTASLDEGGGGGAACSMRTRNRRRNRPSKKLRDKIMNPTDPSGKILMPSTNNGFSVIRNSVSLGNVSQSMELVGRPIEEILNAYGTQMGTKKTQRYIWVQRRFSAYPSTLQKIKNLIEEICRAVMHWTDKKKISIAGSFIEALYLSDCIKIDSVIESFRTVVTVELRRFIGHWPGASRIGTNANVLANIGSLLAECFVKEKDLNWLLLMRGTSSECSDREQVEIFRLLSESVKAAIVASRGIVTYNKLSSKTTEKCGQVPPPVIVHCATELLKHFSNL